MFTHSHQAATTPGEPFGGGKDELAVAQEQCPVSVNENGCTIQSCAAGGVFLDDADGEEDVIFVHYASECVGLREVREMALS